MRYIFFGTPQFSATVLNNLIQANYPPNLVVCNKDKPKGRKGKITPPPVKDIAIKHNIPIWQPETLKEKIPNEKNYDFFLVVAYGKIMPDKLLKLPRLGTLNVHPSILPKYRGPTPIQTAILKGEEETGVSIITLDEEIDHGPILAQKKISMVNENYETLSKKLATLSSEILIDTIPKFIKGAVKSQEQDHNKATFTKKLTAKNGFVEFSDLILSISGKNYKKTTTINKMILALTPEPGVWTITNNNPPYNLPKNKRVKLLESKINKTSLVLKKIQVEGKNARGL